MIQRGEECIVGVGSQSDRGTPVDPQMWIPGRTPSGISDVVEKTMVKETRGTKIESIASEIIGKHAEGNLEFNLRCESIGFILKSLLGQVDSDPVAGQSGAYDHVFTVLPSDPEHPVLTAALSQPANQDYEYVDSMPISLQIKITPDDLVVATVGFYAKKEQENSGTPYVPTFVTRDYYFRHQDVSVKMAANVAGLGAATAMALRDFEITIPNGGKGIPTISSLNPANVIAGKIAITGTMTLDLSDTSLHDDFDEGSYAALQITMTRADVTIGSSTNPSITILLPKVSLETWAPTRPIDDVVTQQAGFAAHYDETTAKAVTITVRNQRSDYNPAES